MVNISRLTWLRFALAGAIVGASAAGIFSVGAAPEAIGAFVGGSAAAIIVKVLHIV